MSLIAYICYFLVVILADLFATLIGFNITLLYLSIAMILLVAAGIGKVFVNRNGVGMRDSKRAEQMDNSVTKPASFKHEFIYLDYSGKTLFFSELPYIVCLIANILLSWLGLIK